MSGWHYFFLATGVVVWTTIAIAAIALILFLIYEALGATIFWTRVLRAGKRAQIQTTLREKLGLWWSILTRHGRGSWTIKNTDEKVKWPRPWYDPECDRERLPA